MNSPHALDHVCDLIPDGAVYQCSGPADRPPTAFTYISGGVTALFGLTPDEVYADADRFFRLIHPDDLPRLMETAYDAIRAGRPFDLRFRQHHVDGTVRLVNNRCRGEFGPDGRVYWNGVVVDVTDRERLAAELGDRNAELERADADLRAAVARVRELEAGIVTMCAWTRTIKMDGRWVPVEEFLLTKFGLRVTHGISDDARRRVEAELRATRDGPSA
ncbi:MAG: PAS domain-containing protein [Gemmataceae bacterium]|nr:PAS domain-containing protein [Gemmataceae bacterium]